MTTVIQLYVDNDPVEVEFRSSNHRYKVDGQYQVGVSTILGVLHKDLMDWASWMAAESFKEAITPYATTERKITKMGLKKLADDAKKAHRTKSQRGKDVGSIAHAWIEEETKAEGGVETPQYVTELLAATEDPDDIVEIGMNMKAAEHCVNQWRQWMADYQIEIIKSEFIVYSKKLGYCGTVDCLFKSKTTGKLYLGDYKTSEPQKVRNSKYMITGYKAYPEHFVQISAYDVAHNEEYQIDPDAYAVIYLPKEGEYKMFTREKIADDRIGWAGLVGVYRWITNIKKEQ